MIISEHCTVVFLRDLKDQDVATGDVGVIVHIHFNEIGDPTGYLVETFAVDGESLDVVHCVAEDIRDVARTDRWHARTAA